MSINSVEAANLLSRSQSYAAAPAAVPQAAPQAPKIPNDTFEGKKKRNIMPWIFGTGALIALCATIAHGGNKVAKTFEDFRKMFKVNAGSGSAVSGGKEKLSSNVDKIVWQKSSELSAPPLSELAGMDKVKAQFDKFVKLVNIDNQSPDLFRKGAGKSKRFSFVLEGPSGTGKTFIAESLAKSLDADMVSINASDILSKYVGEAESGFSAACEAIIKHAEVNPKKQIVVFFDELEGLFRSRTAEGGSEHNSRMVNTILQELDKLKKQNKATNNITVIGTTNVYNNLDTAVQTRLKNPIYIGLPDKDTIAKVLEYQLDKAQNLEIPKGTFDYTKYGEILTSEAAKSKQINMRDLENIAEKYENFLRLNKNNTHNVSKLTEIVNDYLASKIVEKAV